MDGRCVLKVFSRVNSRWLHKKTVIMADYSVHNKENNSELKAEYDNVLKMYLPFIEEMREKSSGTSIEIKWRLMRESLVKPKKE